ncbi:MULTISPECIES: hypothetical protein [Kaistia]|uniref:Protein gp37 n=1 Tax=Kaistia defluvii TaxID=410841 RepID=A0ABV2QV91_9HYPH
MNEADGCTPFHFFPDLLTIDQMLWLGLRTGSVNVVERLKGCRCVPDLVRFEGALAWCWRE